MSLAGFIFGVQSDMARNYPAGGARARAAAAELEGDGAAMVEDTSLPPPWVAAWEPAAKRVFYINMTTNEVRAAPALGVVVVGARARGAPYLARTSREPSVGACALGACGGGPQLPPSLTSYNVCAGAHGGHADHVRPSWTWRREPRRRARSHRYVLKRAGRLQSGGGGGRRGGAPAGARAHAAGGGGYVGGGVHVMLPYSRRRFRSLK
jgi:hypothetical protein